jgi:hypothetical protein
MSIRVFAFALLAASSIAAAAPPKKPHPKPAPPADAAQPADTAQPPDAIDVDAMARAKDGSGSTPSPADSPTADSAPPASDASASAESDASTPAASAEPAAAAPSEAPASDVAPAATSAATQAAAPTLPAGMPQAAPEAASVAASCEARASGLLDQAAKADYAGVARDFDAKMRTELPPAKFKQQWESLGQFGKFVARGQSHLGSGQGYTLVMIPLIFDKANLVAQIACGSDGRIAGFHVNQAPKPEF